MKVLIGIAVGLISSFFGLKYLSNDDEGLEKAKDNIEEAGEDIEEKDFTDADNASDYVDDIFSDIDSKRK